MLVITQDAKPVENRGGVPENAPRRPQVDGALELVVEFDGRFTDVAIAELVGNYEKLEVEGEPLDRKQGHRFAKYLPAKEFQSSLRVTDVQVEQNPD